MSALESCHKSLAVSLSTLSQLIKSFCHSYEVEIQPWTNREPPTLTTLGPTCKRVDIKKQQVDKVKLHTARVKWLIIVCVQNGWCFRFSIYLLVRVLGAHARTRISDQIL